MRHSSASMDCYWWWMSGEGGWGARAWRRV
jgi:hypothetical protein